MAIRESNPRLFSSLFFRILAPLVPIVALMGVLASVIFSLGLSTATHYTNERIEEDLSRNSREIYNLCDNTLQTLLLDGGAEKAALTRIRKATALGKLEEYAQQNNLQLVIYAGMPDNIMLSHGQIGAQQLITTTPSTQTITELDVDGHHYYARQFAFDPWDWHIIVARDGQIYASFVKKIKQSYYVMGGSLLLVSLVLIFYFRRVIHTPVRTIIASIQANQLPDYKGIFEFEFLSNVIREAAQKEQQKQEEITYQAAHDPLTGLINRREFERRLTAALLDTRIHRVRHTLLYLDLDQFKIVNDSCGHNAGDALLQQLATTLQGKLRQRDLLARLGGDEFGVLLENCAEEPALRIAETLREAVSNFRFSWGERSFVVGVSIGLLAFGDEGLSLSDLFRQVDSACYVAKDLGRNRIHVYRSDDGELQERKGQMNWVGRISSALEENRFVLYGQRIHALQENSDTHIHQEILIRMLDETGQAIPPGAFIPAAERYGLMPAIDFWVIRQTFAHYARHCMHAEQRHTLAINLSGATLGDERLLPYIREQLALHQVPPAAIWFEITETAAIGRLDTALKLMQELHQLGCLFALDDFGNGMSSFNYLKTLPVDYVKIDGSFVRYLLDDPIDEAMVRAVHNIGNTMGIQTIAEFVESEAIAIRLREIGVDYAQGYWIGRPEPLTQT